MKKLSCKSLLTVLAIAICLLLSSCSAKVEDVTDGTAMVFASINTPDGIAEGDATAVKSTVQWLVDNAEVHNLNYVSFLGGFTAKPADTYADYTKNKLDTKNLIKINKEDDAFMAHFDALKDTFAVLDVTEIPYGVTYAIEDYFGYGGYRESTYPDVFDETAYNEKVEEHFAFDEQNYYTTYTKNGQKYIVFQLESMPTTPVLDWFNQTMKAKCDYRAIVFTESLIDASGEFWQMWDWADGYPYKAENRGNTKLRNFNLLWTDKPNDGTALWNYAFSKHDNLMLVVTSNADTDGIVTRLEKTEGGCDVVIIAAKTGKDAMLIGISEDNKKVNAVIVDSEGNCVGDVAVAELETLSELEPPINKDIPTVIGMQPNGANMDYMPFDGEKFNPKKVMTRGEVLEIVANLISIHPDQRRDENRFSDLKEGTSVYDAVNFLDSQGHLDYILDEKISLDTEITRGELAKILYRTANTLDAFSGTIADVTEDDEAYYDYGPVIVSGYMALDNDGKFNPAKKVTRAEFTAIMNKVIGLSASERTIDVELLSNTFTDIAGIPEEYDILAATNKNVEAPYRKDIKLDGITETETEFIFDNKLTTITIEKNEANVVSIVNKKTGENILYSETSLLEIDSPATRSTYPETMKRDGDRFRFTFTGGEVVYMIIEVHDTFFTFEIDTEMPIPETCITYAAFDTAHEFSEEPNSLRLSGTLMNTNTFTEYYGGGYSKMTGASVTKGFVNTMGSKYGIVACEYQDFVSAMQNLADDIDPNVGITNKAGGAYSTSYDSNYGDYCIVSSLKPEKVQETIDLALKYNLKQIDLHQGGSSFIQGDYIEGEGFRFANLRNGTASEFKTAVADKFHEAGLELGLHIYSFYVSPSATNVLSVPEYQQQLEYSETFTLAEDVSDFKPKLKTVEDCSNFDLKTSFTYKNSKYILVDEEIMIVERISDSNTLSVTRGVCGTEEQEHKAGAKIKHLIHYYGMFAPIIGSELFYDMAEWVAETYNKGGFDMIYFDAHDGISRHTNDQWYYGAEFVRIVLANCEKAPIVELSTHYPSLWAGRSRLIAWDTATRAYKQFNQNHVNTNKDWMEKMYPTTFGWFNYAPDTSYPEKNTIAKTLFKDDLDHMGSLAIAWNISTVYNSFESAKTNPVMAHNIGYYNMYNKLRLDGYFTEEVRKEIREGKYEYKLVERTDGSWAFREMQYSKSKIYNAADADLNHGKGNNPFEEQTPFIRIESRYSTEFKQEKVLFEIGETLPVTSVAGEHTELDIPNLTNTKALKVRVHGNNSETDAIMVSLTYTGPGEYEYTDYVIPLNFEGWKDIVLVDSDCGEYGYTFSNRNVNAVSWDIFREVPDYSKINGISITLSGDCEGVMMDDIVAYRHTEAPVKNPSVILGDSTITFKTEISGGEYIEFDPATGKAVLNHNNGKTEEVAVQGSITVPAGDFEFTYSAEPTTDAPVRAMVVIGCEGSEIANK